jgi:hypothetical protein
MTQRNQARANGLLAARGQAKAMSSTTQSRNRHSFANWWLRSVLVGILVLLLIALGLYYGARIGQHEALRSNGIDQPTLNVTPAQVSATVPDSGLSDQITAPPTTSASDGSSCTMHLPAASMTNIKTVTTQLLTMWQANWNCRAATLTDPSLLPQGDCDPATAMQYSDCALGKILVLPSVGAITVSCFDVSTLGEGTGYGARFTVGGKSEGLSYGLTSGPRGWQFNERPQLMDPLAMIGDGQTPDSCP